MGLAGQGAKFNSVFRYEFHTKSYDIGFGVLRMTDSSQKKVDDMDVLIPIEKVNSHLVPQDGLVECPNPGTCQFTYIIVGLYLQPLKR